MRADASKSSPLCLPQSRLRVEIAGAVQGVGFRPFVYRLATGLHLTGWVLNDTHGVFIEVEGDEAQLRQFLERLPAEAPAIARITHLNHTWLAPVGYERFEIRHSEAAGARTTLILPDLATCTDCLAELFDPADRRYRYPFINCTHCGPRFTIIEALPYDRPNTTMRNFTLCPECYREYTDPADRRFHAQPNACATCGPHVAFYTKSDHGSGSERLPTEPASPSGYPRTDGTWTLYAKGEDAIRAAARAIRSGAIVAVKGLGGFHLLVDARNPAAVQMLRKRKQRPTKPLAVMARSLEQLAALCEITPAAAGLLQSQAAPIVLLPKRLNAVVAEAVAPGNPNLGVMLPYTPLHHLLLAELNFPVVATSGNLTDEPICTDEWEAFERLGVIADYFLIHNRPIARHADDSVLWLVDGQPQLLRRARGYAPMPVRAPQPLPTILAVGAHLKNTVALSIGEQIFLSQHIGDLETTPAFDAFQRVIADFLRLYAVQPAAIAHDLHPEYLSTKWANSAIGLNNSDNSDAHSSPQPLLIPVQHHHAHLAACLADNAISGPALGLIWDGTGYGLDGTIWGGECLLGDAANVQRVAHLRPFRLPGGEAAVREPRRVALALLWELYGEEIFTWEWLTPVRSFAERERRLLATMLAKGVNTPSTTSMGRLFDGVAALLGLHLRVTFEGEAAMALEHGAARHEMSAYPFPVEDTTANIKTQAAAKDVASANVAPYASAGASPLLLNWAPLLEAILSDLRRQERIDRIAARFHNTLVEMGVAVAQYVGERRVALSGGCFQNRRLSEHLAQRLRAEGFEPLLHRQVPPNDGGVSLGQVMVAAQQILVGQTGH
jgi:hydrogenase maturation protein HypF